MALDHDDTDELPLLDLPQRGPLYRFLERLCPAAAAWWDARQLRALAQGETVALPRTVPSINLVELYPHDLGSLSYVAPEVIEAVLADLTVGAAEGRLGATVERYRDTGPLWAAELAEWFEYDYRRPIGILRCRM